MSTKLDNSKVSLEKGIKLRKLGKIGKYEALSTGALLTGYGAYKLYKNKKS